jgi:5-methylcytosine-specific restriction endonuclease McrA
MIRLKKTKKPDILVKNEVTWIKALLDREAKNEEPTEAEKSKYRHLKIKEALIQETHGKCAYCESKIRHITPGDVEHIIPKSKVPAKIFEWENLTLACPNCNTNKSNHFGNHEGFVDPYEVEPSEHFFFSGPMILPSPISNPGLLTEKVLKLNRPELIERRIDKVRQLNDLIRNMVATKDPEIREVLRTDLEVNETADNKEYAGIARHFIHDALIKLPSTA